MLVQGKIAKFGAWTPLLSSAMASSTPPSATTMAWFQLCERHRSVCCVPMSERQATNPAPRSAHVRRATGRALPWLALVLLLCVFRMLSVFIAVYYVSQSWLVAFPQYSSGPGPFANNSWRRNVGSGGCGDQFPET